MKPRHLRQMACFIAVGVLNTAFGYAVFSLLIWLEIPPSAALLIATAVGILFNFMTTGRIVFGSRDIRLLGRFAAIYGLIYIINLILLHLVGATGLSVIPSQGICLLATVSVSFGLQKFLVFKGSSHADH